MNNEKFLVPGRYSVASNAQFNTLVNPPPFVGVFDLFVDQSLRGVYVKQFFVFYNSAAVLLRTYEKSTNKFLGYYKYVGTKS